MNLNIYKKIKKKKSYKINEFDYENLAGQKLGQ